MFFDEVLTMGGNLTEFVFSWNMGEVISMISDHFLMLTFLTKNTELYVVTWMTKKVTLCVLNTWLGK